VLLNGSAAKAMRRRRANITRRLPRRWLFDGASFVQV